MQRATELSIIYVLSVLLCYLAQLNLPVPYYQDFSYIFVLCAFLALPLVAVKIFGRPHGTDPLFGLEWNTRDALLGLGIAVALFVPVGLGAYLWNVCIMGGDFHFAWQNYDKLEQNLLYSLLVQILLVALPEEFFYRGYLQTSILQLAQRRLSTRQSAALAIVVTSLLFGLGHVLVSANPMRMNVFFPSLLFGFVRLKTKTLTACILLHALANIMMQIIMVHFGG